jgi:hypothetical protein
MKLVKSLLLGSVAGIAAVAGAQAADLPVRKAAPVDYVRVCSTYGAGYFFIPGSDTCLKISGFVDGEMQYQSRERDRDDFDTFGMRGRFRINLDARQPTEYGLLRAFIRFDVRRESGVYVSGGEGGGGPATDATRLPDQAYIQFGGLTAGRAQSFFDFWTGDDLFTTLRTTSDTKTQLFAYTMTFGGGLSATLSLEDTTERRVLAGPFAVPTGFTAPTVVGGFPFLGSSSTAGFINSATPGGFEYPDVVANVRLDQAWGSAQLSGALHDNSVVNSFVPFGAPVGAAAINGDDEIGWAVQAGVMFKLPFIAPGDQLWLNAAYSEGAGGYNGLPSSATFTRFTEVRAPISDVFVDQFGGVQQTEVFSVSGKFLHYWLPNLRSNFFGGYAKVDFNGAASAFVCPTSLGLTAAACATDASRVGVGFNSVDIVELGANVIWTPVKQLDIGVEAVYRSFSTDNPVAVPFAGGTFGPSGAFTTPAGTTVRRLDEDDVIEARLRIRREF